MKKHDGKSMWIDPPSDVLHHIIERMSLKDRLRFGSVCRSWRIEATMGASIVPLLIVYRRRCKYDCDGCLDGVNLSIQTKEETQQLRWPSNCMEFPEISSHGWLVVRAPTGQTSHLLNPFSGARIQLPNMSKHKHRSMTMTKAILSAPPTLDTIATGKCFFACIFYFRNDLGFCRLTDKRWTLFGSYKFYHRDLVYHKGVLYVASTTYWMPTCLVIDAWDVGGLRPKRVSVLPTEPLMLKPLMMERLFEFHFVESCGQLLLVAHGYDLFRVFKLEGRSWVEIYSLGDEMLFVGANSFSVTAFHGYKSSMFKKGCIYYVSSQEGSNDPHWLEYSLEEKKAERTTIEATTTCIPMWIAWPPCETSWPNPLPLATYLSPQRLYLEHFDGIQLMVLRDDNDFFWVFKLIKRDGRVVKGEKMECLGGRVLKRLGLS